MAVSGQSIGVIRMTAQSDSVTETHRISSIRLLGDGAVASLPVAIQNTAGDLIFASVTPSTDFSESFDMGGRVSVGIVATTLPASTEVFFYVDY